MNQQRTQHHQLINEEKKFDASALKNLSDTLKGANKEYYSVAIIGVQNSGKSTLLNQLFGTNFDVLETTAGTRTTRGIWVSLDQSENIIVLDVEGNDAMDRAEQQDYEKMVATYALVAANVLIINIWSKSLGQYTGSQYQTLKVVMDICIDHFKQESPKTILFCVRDFNEEYDNEYEIKRKIIHDVNNIWLEIKKPPEFQKYEGKPEKFFTLETVVLRRFREKYPNNFFDDVKKLRNKFTDKNSDQYIFKKQKTEFNLPIEDVPQLWENAWHSITKNKKLNLPNQKEQLASFRCSTIVSELEQDFQAEITQLKKASSANFGSLKSQFIENYDKKTYHYGKDIVEQKRNELSDNFDDQIKKIIIDKINALVRKAEQQFLNEAKLLVYDQKNTLQQQLQKLKNAKIQKLVEYIRGLNFQVPDRKDKIDELTANLNKHVKQTKNHILEFSRSQFEKQSSRVIRLLSSELLKEYFGVNFWSESLNGFKNKSNFLIDEYRKKYTWITGEELDAVEYDNFFQFLEAEFKTTVKKQLEKSLSNRVFQFFNKKLNYDEEDNRTLNFNLMKEDQIAQHFDRARDATNELIKRINEFNYSQSRRSSMMQGMDEQNYLFESTWLSTTVEQIDKKMIAEYEKIIRRKKQGDMKGVPWWLLLFIVYFVYDDLMFSEDTHPFMHYLIVIPIILVFLMFALGQGKVLKQGVNLVMDKLKEKLPFLR